MNSNYVGLHRHSTYSPMDGYGTAEQVRDRLLELNQTAMGLTDHGNACGHPEFFRVLGKAGIKLVPGIEFYHCEDMAVRGVTAESNPEGQRTARASLPHLTVLALTQEGYRNLLALHRLSYREGFYYRPRIDTKTLVQHQSGLAVFSGCVGGQIARLINADKEDLAFQWLRYLQQAIEHFYAEITPITGLGISERHCQVLWRMAEELKLPRIVTDDAHFPRPADHAAEDTMTARAIGTTVDAPDRKLRLPAECYHCSGDEILARLQAVLPGVPHVDLLAAMVRTKAIANCCAVEMPRASGPIFNVAAAFTGMVKPPPTLKIEHHPEFLLRQWVEEGKERRWSQGELPGIGDSALCAYTDREVYEFEILRHHNFVNYFLVVADLVRWAREENILCVARGSCGGSLLCWYLGITELDPIKHDLPVERFIGFHRKGLPDIDLDVDSRHRDRFYRYLQEKYGVDNCVQIAALSRFRARQALRDTAAAHNLPDEALAALLDLVPEAQQADDGLKATGVLRRLSAEHEGAKVILAQFPAFAVAADLEGQVRTASVHAAGFVVSKDPVHHTFGIMGKPADLPVAACDMTEIEQAGGLKIDLLAVDMLTTLAQVAEAQGEGAAWVKRLPMTDAAAYGMLGEGRNAGVFQLQGTAAGRLMRDLRPRDFDDVAAVVALARPGPLQSGGAATYVGRRQNHAEVFEGGGFPSHPILWNILGTTQGIVLYQEQVMRIAREVGGFEWDEVEKIRKVVSKIQGATEMDAYLDRYLTGAKERGVPEAQALQAWEQCKKAGNYSFNKCVTGDTIVERGSSGRNGGGEITIRELYEAQQSRTPWGAKIRSGKLTILQMDADGRVRPRRLRAIFHNGQRPVIAITTCSGRIIKTTTNHRLLTDRGFRCDLKVGDHLVVMGRDCYEKRGWKSTAKGNHYSGSGVPSGPENPAWIDGRTPAFEDAKTAVVNRAQGRCEFCEAPEEGRFEFAHLRSLEACGGDYLAYHSSDNIRRLCNSCHKRLDYQKGERKGRWSKGRPTELEEIIDISLAGVEDVFDLEMATPEHNFVANGIVSHNSHGYAYGKVACWSAYLKCHHPAQFAAAFACNEEDADLRRRIFNEFRDGGGKFVLVDPNRSRAHFVALDDTTILGGFQDLEGCGPKTAEKLVAGQPYADWDAFYRACPKTVRDRLWATGIHEGRLAQDALVLIAPWFVEVTYTDLERAAAAKVNATTVRAAGHSSDKEVKLIGRVTQVELINVVAEAKKYGQRPPAPGEPTHRAVVTLADETGSVLLHVSPRRLEQLVAVRNPLRGPYDGVGNSLYASCSWNYPHTKLYVEDLICFHEAPKFEPATPDHLDPVKTKKATTRKRKGKADEPAGLDDGGAVGADRPDGNGELLAGAQDADGDPTATKGGEDGSDGGQRLPTEAASAVENERRPAPGTE